MNTGKKSVMKKIGWTLVSFLPMAGAMVIQIGCSVAASVLISVITMMQQGGQMAADELAVYVSNQILENIIPILMVSQILEILVFGLWYYFAYGKKPRPEGTGKPKLQHILLILVLGLAAQFAISGVLSIVETLAPSLLEKYEQLMEMAGITETTLLSILSTVILAPISEELICRGLVFKLAGKVSPNFWVANIIQALSFGILHANWVQGIYAFALGIVLGLVYRRFQNIWLCMLLHAAMNFSSILVGPYYSLFPEKYILAAFVATMLAAAAVFTLCYRKIMCKEHE